MKTILAFIIEKYYDFLIWLEDVLGFLETKVNDHRKKIDNWIW